MKKYFGTDGIRGIVGDDIMNQDMAYRLGQALVLFCKDNDLLKKIIIGHDTRGSADELLSGVIAGIEKMGGEAVNAGIISTPGLAHLAKVENIGLGLMITASHNDYRYNGFKIFNNKGEKIDDKNIAKFEELLDIVKSPPTEQKLYSHKASDSYSSKYEKFLFDIFKDDDFSDLRVVIDCANGATSQIAPNIFTRLTKNAHPIYISPDEKNINDNCGSQYPEILSEEVIKRKADIGLAFDGDGDRIIVVDETGQILTGDHILYIIGKMMKLKGELKNDCLVSSVMSNIGFIKALETEAIKHKVTDVGDRIICQVMKKVGANLGGEESGHIVLLDHHTSGDGVLSGLMMLRALKFFNTPLSILAQGFTPFPKILKNVEVNSKPEIDSLPELKKLIEKIEKELENEGRVLVRYSGTEPLCRVMVEGRDEEITARYVNQIAEKIEELGI